MTRDPDPQAPDDACLDALFDAAVATLADGEQPSDDLLAAVPDHLRDAAAETLRLARKVAFQRRPGRPSLAGYDVLDELGRGGMGIVYLARQASLGRLVALKILPPGAVASGAARARMLQEARALAKVRHAGVVPVFDVIDAPDVCAFAMELIDGPSLAEVLRRLRAQGERSPSAWARALGGEVLPGASVVQTACRLGIGVARALGALHRAGLVHRDVKPSNILLRRDGQPVLSDFGLVRAPDATALTRAGQFVGTAAYAAPEQLRAEPATAASDVFALGAVLYEALTLASPWSSRGRRSADDEPTALRARDRRLPRDLETILATAMAAAPAQRYADGDAFADELERLLALQPIAAQPTPWFARVAKSARRQRRSWAAGLVGVVLTTLAVIVLSSLARERAATPLRAAAELRQARLLLLQPAHGEHVYVSVFLQRTPTGDNLRAEQARLGDALAHFDRALALRWDLDVACERAAVVIARAVLGQADGADFDARVRVACPTTVSLAGSQTLAGFTGLDLSGLDPRDRRTLGLVAMLLGDVATCHRAWEPFLLQDGNAFLDAAAGVQHVVLEQYARAYPCLLSGCREFPEAGFLWVKLAEAAVRVGDLGLADRWLREAEGKARQDPFEGHLRVWGDLWAARGDLAQAEVCYWRDIERHTAVESKLRLAALFEANGRALQALDLRFDLATTRREPRFAREFTQALAAWWEGLKIGARLDFLASEMSTVQRLDPWLGADAIEQVLATLAQPDVAHSQIPSLRDLVWTRRILHMPRLTHSFSWSLRRWIASLGLVADSPAGREVAGRHPLAAIGAWLALEPALGVCTRLMNRVGMALAPLIALVASLFGPSVAIGAQTCVAPPTGVVGWWPLDGNGQDVTGSHPGVVVGAGGSFAPAKVGSGFVSGGPGSIVRIEDAPALDVTTLTVECWVRLDAIGSFNHLIACKGDSAGADVLQAFCLGIVTTVPPAGRVFFLFGNGSQSNIAHSPASLSLGVFHHLAATIDGASIRLYVDGSLQADVTQTVTPFNSPEPIRIGGLENTLTTFPGVIDDVTLYGRALSAAEILSIYLADSAGKCRPDLVDAATTSVAAVPTTISAFGGLSTLTVTPRNADSGLLGAGLTVTLATTAGTLLNSVTDNGDGTYTQTLQATPTAAGAVVSATVNSIPITDTASVTFVPIDPARSTITVSPDTTFLGGHATVTVTPRDDAGLAVGSGKAVVLQTTLGTLAGSLTDNLDGTYTQRLDGTVLGTAAITATADGLPLTPSASLTVLDGALGRVIGLRSDNNAFPYDTIQQAVNRAEQDQLVRILVNPGTYDELVALRGKHDLSLEGLSASGLVTVRGFRISQSADLTLAYFDVDASSNARHGIKLLGGNHASARITVHDCMVHDTRNNFDGVRVLRDNCDVVLRNLWIEQSNGDGIFVADGPCGVTVTDVTVLASGQIGIRCTDEATVRIERCRIEDSGTRGDDRQGYAIFRQRRAHGATPESITLIANTFAGNRGRIVAGKSDRNLGNYDQIVDPTDAQPGY